MEPVAGHGWLADCWNHLARLSAQSRRWSNTSFPAASRISFRHLAPAQEPSHPKPRIGARLLHPRFGAEGHHDKRDVTTRPEAWTNAICYRWLPRRLESNQPLAIGLGFQATASRAQLLRKAAAVGCCKVQPTSGSKHKIRAPAKDKRMHLDILEDRSKPNSYITTGREQSWSPRALIGSRLSGKCRAKHVQFWPALFFLFFHTRPEL